MRFVPHVRPAFNLSSSQITLTPFEQAQLGDECGGYSSPPPCLADPSTPLGQQQDDTEIMLFKVNDVAVWVCTCAANTAPQAMLTDLFGPAKVGRCADGDALAPPQPLRLPDSVARSIEQMCLQT